MDHSGKVKTWASFQHKDVRRQTLWTWGPHDDHLIVSRLGHVCVLSALSVPGRSRQPVHMVPVREEGGAQVSGPLGKPPPPAYVCTYQNGTAILLGHLLASLAYV